MLCDDMSCQLLLRNNCPNIKISLNKEVKRRKNILDKNCYIVGNRGLP